MSTLLRLGEAAVCRDLRRARVVLASGSPLRTHRRELLCEHLAWMADLVGDADPVVRRAAGAAGNAARAFHADPERPYRAETIGTVGSLLRAASRRTDWLAPGVGGVLRGNVLWLLDGVTGHAGAGILLDADARVQAREQAPAYRRWQIDLWGPVALVPGAGVLVR